MSLTDAPIAEQLRAVQRQAAQHLPEDVLEVFGAQVLALREAGSPAGVAVPAESLPEAELLDVHGQPTTLTTARDGRTAVIVFYRGAWCPYCNVTLRAYQTDLVPELADRDAVLIAVSPQTPDNALSMREKNDLTYTVVSDPASNLAASIGIRMDQTQEVRDVQSKIGVAVAQTNIDGTDSLPMPTVLIVDAAGTIRWIDVHADFTTRTEPDDILTALDTVLDRH